MEPQALGQDDAGAWYRIAVGGQDPAAFGPAIVRASDLLRVLPAPERRRLPFASEVEALRALSVAAERRHDEALAMIAAAAKDLGDGADLRFARGLVLQGAGRHAAAVDAFSSAIRVANGPVPPRGLSGSGRRTYRSALAESLHVAGRATEARQAAAAARAEAPDSFNVFTEPLGRIGRAPFPSHSLGLLADAARCGRDAAGAWLRAAALLLALGRREVAEDALEKAAHLGADPAALQSVRNGTT